MGNMKPIDSAVVKNETYDVLSADTMGGEYIETIGAACQNPDGYTSGSLFLGKDNDVQHLYRATAAIALGETIILDTNCVYTTVSGELEGKAEESEVTSLNEALTNEVSARTELGAHNLLNLSLAEIKSLNTGGTWNRNAYTFRGVTFTINDDLSISTSGTVNTGNLAFYLKNSIPLKNGTYKVIGCPSGATSYELLAIIGSTEYKDRGNGAEFTISNNTVSISIYTRLNQDMSGLTFKPQIILATDPSTEFTPYAMTNRELTMRREATTISNINVISSDSVCCLEFAGANLGTVTGAWSSVITLNKKPKTVLFDVVEDNNRNLYDLAVNDNGLVQIRTHDQNSHDLTSLRCQIWFVLI